MTLGLGKLELTSSIMDGEETAIAVSEVRDGGGHSALSRWRALANRLPLTSDGAGHRESTSRSRCTDYPLRTP